jgi:hypothetical protein
MVNKSQKEIDINRIPETKDEITQLAAFADDHLDPDSPEFKRVVLLLNIAANRIDELGIE